MIKKFVSMGTAVLLMATGISFMAAPAANAAPPTITSLSYLDGIQRTITGFSPSTTTYAVTANNSAVMITTAQTSGGATAVHTCNGRVMTFQQEMCSLNSGANTWTIVVTLSGESTTYTITFNYAPPAPPANPTVSGITSNGATVDATIIVAAAAAAAPNPVDLDLRLLPGTGSTDASAALQTIQLSRSATTVALTGLSSSTNYRFVMVNRANNFTIGGQGGVVSFTTLASGSSAPSSSEAAQAAAAAAAALAAAIAKAKAALSTQFASNKPATLEQFLDADFKIRNSNVAAKVSAAMLKLPTADRDNLQKVNEIIKLEDFLDRVSVLDTRSTVRAGELVSRGLLPATSTYKHSVVRGLTSYPNGSLDSLEKIEAAIKEQIFKAEAPKRRLAEIKAKIEARKK